MDEEREGGRGGEEVASALPYPALATLAGFSKRIYWPVRRIVRY